MLFLGMMKRSKNKKKPKKTVNKEISKQIRHLETDLKYTLRAIDGRFSDIDVLFTDQANRIQLQIDKLKEKQ